MLHPHQRRLDAGAGELVLGRFGVFLAFERADPHAVDRAPGLLALGDLARVKPDQRQPGALLLGVLGARVGAGLDEVGERIGRRAPVGAGAAAAAARRSAAGGRWSRSPAAAACAPARRSRGRRRTRRRCAPAAGRALRSCRPAARSGPSCGSSRPVRRPARRLRCGTLLMNGTGTLVTYSATPSASASPISRPTIRPSRKPPRCARTSGCGHAAAPGAGGFARHRLGGADAEQRQRVAQHLARGRQQRQPGRASSASSTRKRSAA